MNKILSALLATTLAATVAAPAFAQTPMEANKVTCGEYGEKDSPAQIAALTAMYAHAALLGKNAVVSAPADSSANTGTETGDSPKGNTDESRAATAEDAAALLKECQAHPDMMAMHALVSMPLNDVK